MAALVAGDQRALGPLYERFATRAYSVARRICHDGPLAEEAVQDAFLALWRTPTRYDPCAGSFARWMLTVVHHKSVDLVRQEQVRRRAFLAGGEDQQWPLQVGPHAAALASERAERLQAALRQLPIEQRRTVMLAYYGGHTQREISTLTTAPLGTVKSRMFAALQRLHVLLAPYGADLEPE